jgi:dehypoxanthine futalosine cyclase
MNGVGNKLKRQDWDQGRITAQEALKLLRGADTAELMGRADALRCARHGCTTYFTHSMNLNPTNICENQCELCAFWREAGSQEAYFVTLDEARRRLEEARGLGLTDLHIVGGIQPQIDLAYCEALFKMAREILPSVLRQGLTAVEIHYLAQKAGVDIRTVLQRLQAAGLQTLPGGGAEIFAADTRKRICSHKISAAQWLAVHEQAHGLGIPSNATMLFGHVESDEDIVDHMSRLRDLQDHTRGFLAFIPLPFQPGGTRVEGAAGVGGYRMARVVALARIFLDNIPHLRVLVNYMDRKLLQVLLHAGANDLGGTSLDERIALAAGSGAEGRFGSTGDMAAFVARVGLTPRLVNSRYEQAGDRRLETGGASGLPPAASSLPEAKRTDVHDARPGVDAALAQAWDGRRLTADEAVALLDGADLWELGVIAHRRRHAQVPGDRATFVIDRNLNVTNVCEAGCRFCAFHVPPGSDRAFTLTVDEVVVKAVEAVRRGATQVLIQGGLNPDLDLAFYERMLGAIKQRVDVCLHCLSPAEVQYLARRSRISIGAALERLHAAGLDSLPGGGAEILVDAVRQAVSPRKISADDWFEVMETAHGLGLKTTATMVYGLGETSAQRVEHLLRVRALQDRTGGFTAFIPWSFAPDHTQLPREPATGPDYLRMIALSRLVLDNVLHIQAGWVTEGPELAQLALVFGADDWGGILMEEQVVRAAAGAAYDVDLDRVTGLIAETGLTPVQRTTQYVPLRILTKAG